MDKRTLVTGFSRIGENRELKIALENYWAQKIPLPELQSIAKNLRKKHWLEQKERGIDLISSNDFSFYDLMLDTTVMLNAIPDRFKEIQNKTDRYFAMARGSKNCTAMEMTKWFNTNYHYIVPELNSKIDFKLNADKVISEYNEAKEYGIASKINLIGPITYLSLSKSDADDDCLDYIDLVLPVYEELMAQISLLDDQVYVQFDEPVFAKDPSPESLSLIEKVYNTLCRAGTNNKIIVTTYFEHSCEAATGLARTNIWGIGLDFVHGKDNLKSLDVIKDKTLVAGVVNGRNIWINDLSETLKLLDTISQKIPKNKIIISTSCSLLHVPYTKENEPQSDLTKWFAFAREKVEETALLAELFFCDDHKQYSDKITHNSDLINTRARSDMFTDQTVTQRVADISKTEREGNAAERLEIQKKAFNLPELPTTTIGSFPQTAQIRKTRSDYKSGCISAAEYDDQIKAYIDDCISFQANIGLDVLVHGEPERNDMVEYFGEMLNGFHFTKKGWVQSYGSRCVKPPVIYADISRPAPMTVKWISYAQSKTRKIVKGMLTGPVTIINWSFVREDIPRDVIAKQIALSLYDEIDDLQKAGIKIIQVDEAAFKEGYPLRKDKIAYYEKWALESFKIAVSPAWKETQIHTHMCYSEFNDIIETIEKMDADVITIETARSGNRLLRIFREREYKSEIGPGVYDIHSPRIPETEEIKDEIVKRLEVVDRDRIWINPDCGLKTRKWEEARPALKNMVEAAKALR